jgi:hypothetical protein
MRVAFLLSGEMRIFDRDDIQHSLRQHIWDKFDQCDVFVSVWHRRGFSHCHGGGQKTANADDGISDAVIREFYPNVRAVHVEVFEDWLAAAPANMQSLYREGFVWENMNIKGTMVPQLYKMYDSNRLKQEYEQAHQMTYDLVIRARPDLFYLQPLTELSPLHAVVYAINCPPHYWPSRVYDCFFYSDSPTMDIISNAYWHIPELIDDPFDNGLHPRDACRIMYVQCLRNGIQVKDMQSVVCEIRR